MMMGALVVTYTSFGGIKAVTWADVQQMMLIFCGLVMALFMAVHLLPATSRFETPFRWPARAGRLNAVTFHFDWNDRYNVWSGLIGGMFLALAYFGCDQSQVQRYLTGKSIEQSRLSLIFNAMAKIPMQFFILFIGAMVFVFFIFEQPAGAVPTGGTEHVRNDPRLPAVEQRYEEAFARRKEAAEQYLERATCGRPARPTASLIRYQKPKRELERCARGRRATGGKRILTIPIIFFCPSSRTTCRLEWWD